MPLSRHVLLQDANNKLGFYVHVHGVTNKLTVGVLCKVQVNSLFHAGDLMKSIDESMQLSIDNSLKEAAPMFEGMAREHIPALARRIQEDLDRDGWKIVPKETIISKEKSNV